MLLSRQNAQRIVQELNDVISHKINMMDDAGIIVASSDPERVGEYHEGAGRILKLGKKELIVHRDGEYDGCKEGVNYPIVIQGQTIGVIGITGPHREAVKYGQIIQRITGILLREMLIKEQKLLDENIRNRYAEEWMKQDDILINQEFVERGRAIRIDITLPRRVVAFAVLHEGNGMFNIDSLESAEKALQQLRQRVKEREPDSIYLQTASGLVCAVPDRSDEQMRQFVRRLKESVSKDGAIRVAAGIDDACYPYPQIRTAEKQASKALQVCLRNEKKDICFYHDLGLEIFLDEVSDLSKAEYVRRIFKDYEKEELSEAICLLEIFYECRGSLGRTSERMHIHKNTLQYKLLKIRDRTGYDPRSLKDTSMFYIAAYFYREIRRIL
ncbi:helix-turn-helix domain-containing protein [Ruminococcus sp. OA3]|uniref:CdaR family transcriptional regulator n=1 Tax=Ruminococcus sp. OA3 TaxID=2914164 RepID=UPI001F0542DE|nr:sugar diacid recognition domain-containing protein [Ruminococcus sp. OA3]MCH1983047.1 helix-turn-helix domain-containing protein [Ruminococcus sp. OA3]